MSTWGFRDILNRVMGDLGDESSLNLSQEIENKTFSKYDVSKVSLIYNILAAITVFLSIFVFKLPLWVLILCIVGVDVLFTIGQTFYIKYIESEYQRTINDRGRLGQEIAELHRRCKDNDERLANICVKCKKAGGYSHEFCKKKKELEKEQGEIKAQLRELEEIFESFDDEVEETVEHLETLLDDKEVRAITDYKRVLEAVDKQIKSWGEIDKEYITVIDSVLNKSKQIIEELEKNPSAYSTAQLHFNVYLVEIIQTINYINSLRDSKDKEEYNIKLAGLIKEYMEYVDALIEKVRRYNLQNIDVSINTLLKDIQDKKEML